MSSWAAFWLFCCVFIAAEVYITMQGIDTFLWQFRTPAELELQKRLIDKQTIPSPAKDTP